MKREVPATIEENMVAPRLRRRESMPPIPFGFVPTRLDGEIVFVSEPDESDRYHGKSPYTKRQIRELEGIRTLRREQKTVVREAEIIVYEAYVLYEARRKYVSYD